MPSTTVTIKAKDKTKKAFASVKSNLKTISKRLSLVGIASVAGLGVLVKQSLKSADSLAKTADQLGITTEGLGGLRHAAELTGVAQGAFDKGLKKMIVSVRDADNGLMTYKRSYDKLGLSTENLKKLNPEEQFLEIAGALSKVKNNTDKVGIAYDIFGAKGVGIINTLNLGKEGLQKITEEAKAYGIALNRVDAAKIEEANDAITRVSSVIKGIGTTIAVNLAPYIRAIGNSLAKASVESNGFKDSIVGAIESIVNAIGILGDALRYLNIVWQTVKLGAVGAFNVVLQSIQWVDEAISDLINKIPGLEATPSQDLKIWADASAMAVNDVAKGLEELLTSTLPSEVIKTELAAIQEQANTLATQIAETKKVSQFNEGDQEALDREFEAAESQMERMVALSDWRDEQEAMSVARAKQLAQDRFAVAQGITGNLAQLMSSSSKKEFEVGKKFSLANALIKGYEAVTGAYAAGARIGGPWLGAAYAAAAAIATKVQIDNIRKAQFGGGGGVSVGGSSVSTGSSFNGGAPPQPIGTTAAASPGSGGTTVIQLTGSDTDTFTYGQVDDMFTKFKEAIDRGDRVLIDSNSRQALELTGQ